MENQTHHSDEKRKYPRSPICRKIKFIVGANIYKGLIGDISSGGISIISKHKFIRGAVIDLKIPPMSGTVQYCVPYRNDFFKTGLRLLGNNH